MSDNEIAPLGDHGRLLLQAAVMKEIKSVVDASKATCMAGMQPGDRRTVTHGDVELGSVTLTKPKKEATVTDRAAFIEWVGEYHDSEVEAGWQPKPGVTMQDLVDLLIDVIPAEATKVLEHVVTVRPAFETRILSEVAPVPGSVIPGVEVQSRAGWLTVRPSADALVQARALIAGRPMPELGGAA